jgi:hypothetical protein
MGLKFVTSTICIHGCCFCDVFACGFDKTREGLGGAMVKLILCFGRFSYQGSGVS